MVRGLANKFGVKVEQRGTRGRGDKREVVRRIDEFFPRGSAGRREVRGPRGTSKAVMPRTGSRTKNPKCRCVFKSKEAIAMSERRSAYVEPMKTKIDEGKIENDKRQVKAEQAKSET